MSLHKVVTYKLLESKKSTPFTIEGKIMRSINAKQMNVNELSSVTGGNIQHAPKRNAAIVVLITELLKRTKKSAK